MDINKLRKWSEANFFHPILIKPKDKMVNEITDHKGFVSQYRKDLIPIRWELIKEDENIMFYFYYLIDQKPDIKINKVHLVNEESVRYFNYFSNKQIRLFESRLAKKVSTMKELTILNLEKNIFDEHLDSTVLNTIPICKYENAIQLRNTLKSDKFNGVIYHWYLKQEKSGVSFNILNIDVNHLTMEILTIPKLQKDESDILISILNMIRGKMAKICVKFE